MNLSKWDIICQAYVSGMNFLLGDDIGAKGFAGLLIITFINSLLWISRRKEYGTTIGRVVKKQSVELLTTVGVLFSLKLLFDAVGIIGFTRFIFIILIVRQVLFLLMIAKQVFEDHDLDQDNRITNIAFGRIFKTVFDTFKLDPEDGTNSNPLTGGHIPGQTGKAIEDLDDIKLVDKSKKTEEPIDDSMVGHENTVEEPTDDYHDPTENL